MNWIQHLRSVKLKAVAWLPQLIGNTTETGTVGVALASTRSLASTVSKVVTYLFLK